MSRHPWEATSSMVTPGYVDTRGRGRFEGEKSIEESGKQVNRCRSPFAAAPNGTNYQTTLLAKRLMMLELTINNERGGRLQRDAQVDGWRTPEVGRRDPRGSLKLERFGRVAFGTESCQVSERRLAG
jgi:hypothetical protein